ncbi:catalase-like [Uloborus diversus]|uniref:catalase-like n=1 Tax=Uloborus diversus TaxID=327109 RepID=UPI00240A40F8|nr:catalase-like [Uloborus diversus]
MKMLIFILLTIQVIKGEVCPNGSLKERMAPYGVLKSEIGTPIDDHLNSLTAGPRGPILMQDSRYLEEMAHFDRERIPDRVVHGKGNGAFGYFIVTDDVTHYTKAKLFNRIGKRTPIAVRFSTTNGEVGSPDSLRTLRGMAIKFYTEEGNWDLVGNNIPVFPIRDPMLFPSLIKVTTVNSVSNLRSLTESFWDFVSLRPENLGTVVFLFSDRGIPQSYRHMHGFGINTFKLVNATGTPVYCRFSYLTDQGIRNLTAEEAQELAGMDPDAHGRDLFQAIEQKNFPSWTFYIQVMTTEEARRVSFNPFDSTREWPEDAFPFIRVGKLVLNRNPTDHFSQVEQLALCPANLVPGIEASPDKILQGRLFSYRDSQRYRLGANHNQLPVNYPFRSPPNNYQRNGFMTVTRSQAFPSYYPNSYKKPVQDPFAKDSPFEACGIAARHDSSEEDNYSQPRMFYNRLDSSQRDRLLQNMLGSLRRTSTCIQGRVVEHFKIIDSEFGERIEEALENSRMEM